MFELFIYSLLLQNQRFQQLEVDVLDKIFILYTGLELKHGHIL